MILKVQLSFEVDVNILVCGFMGSGKTTFVEGFKENPAGYFLHDLDSEISEHLGISPMELGEWITRFGMPKFRELEALILKKLLMQKTLKMIALGGGTLEAPGVWEMAKSAKLIFIDTDFDTCFSRIKNDPNRPLTALGEGQLRELYKKRRHDYEKADLTLTPTQIKEIDGMESLVHNLVSI